MRLVYILFLLFSCSIIAQNRILEIKIDSIVSYDSIDIDRKYIVNYHIKNLSDKKVSFLLDTLENDTITGVNTNSLKINLYQDNIQIKDFYFFKSLNYLEFQKMYRILRNSKSQTEIDSIINNPEFIKFNIHPIFLEKALEKGELDHKKIRLFENQTHYNTMKVLNPKETKHFQLELYWNKNRYFINEESEFYLDAMSNYSLELSFSTEEFDYMYFNSTDGFDYDASSFVKSTNVSNKMPIQFYE